MEDDFFQTCGLHGSSDKPLQCSALRKNGHVMLKSRPCKIVEMSTSKTGKHGNTKVHLVGVDIFTEEKYEDVFPSTHNVDVPVVKEEHYTVVHISGSSLSLMNENGDIREDLKLPENDLGKEIDTQFKKEENLMVSVLQALGEEKVHSWKHFIM